MESPTEDTAKRCDQHENCIRGFKQYAAGPNMGYAGWWHLKWLAEEGGAWNQGAWELTDPKGGKRRVVVRAREHPVGELVGAVPGIALHAVADAILEKGLFPPD